MALSDSILLDQWLQSGIKEEVIEPELPIVDPHHHLWDIRQYTESPHSRFSRKSIFVKNFQKIFMKEDIILYKPSLQSVMLSFGKMVQNQ